MNAALDSFSTFHYTKRIANKFENWKTKAGEHGLKLYELTRFDKISLLKNLIQKFAKRKDEANFLGYDKCTNSAFSTTKEPVNLNQLSLDKKLKVPPLIFVSINILKTVKLQKKATTLKEVHIFLLWPASYLLIASMCK